MSFALSCVMLDRIAAVGLVASAMTVPWEWCPRREPMPVIAFHGTADPVTPYAGGRTWIGPVQFPDISVWSERWALRNKCAAEPVESDPAAGVSRSAWLDCESDAPVILYTIHDGGHTWPGGMPLPEWFLGRTTDSIDATELMWQFFEEHPLSR
jgi:polyhydroxybutyrate depolymerase